MHRVDNRGHVRVECIEEPLAEVHLYCTVTYVVYSIINLIVRVAGVMSIDERIIYTNAVSLVADIFYQ